MNKIQKWIYAIGMTIVFSSGGKLMAQEVKYSLKESIAHTLKNHPNSTIYKNSALIANEKVRENKSSFLPSVSASVGMDYNIKLQTTVIPAGGLSAEETKLQMGNKFSNSASIQADQNIFDKSASIDIKSSKVDKSIADLNVLKENETLIYNTTIAYYEVLTYKEKGLLLKESEKQYEALVKILKLRFEQGVVKKSEYDRAKVNYNNVQSDIEANNSSYTLSLNKLKNAMGLALETPLDVEDINVIDSRKELPFINEGSSDVSNTLDYKIDEKNLELAKLAVDKKKASFLPTLSAYGKYGATAFGSEFTPSLTNWYDYSAIGLKLSVPIFSGFKKQSQLTQSRLSYDNQLLTNKLNIETYKLNIQNSGTKLVSSYTSLKKNKENLDLAKEMLEASTVEYREGTSTLSSFLDAEYSYKEARTNYITSLLDYLNAEIEYEKNSGNLTQFINNL